MQQWNTMTTDDATNTFLKHLLEAFKIIYILKIIQLMKVAVHICLQFMYTS